MIISYALNGRFGNNLFQYLAMKILQHVLYKYDLLYTYQYNICIHNSFVVNEDNYKDILQHPSEYLHTLANKHIYVDGYFQYDFHIREYKQYVSSLLTGSNIERINHQYTVNQFIEGISSITELPEEDALYIHVRLDDFIPEKACMKVGSYLKILQQILSEHTFTKAVIIVDKIRHKFEQDYIQCLYSYLTNKKITTEIQQSTMLNDFSMLYHAQYLLSSNSTFCYLAGLLGTHKKSWCPVNTRYSHQSITMFDDHTIPFDIEYI